MQTERLLSSGDEVAQAGSYHVVAIHEKTGTKTYCTRTPLTHNEACNVKKAFGHHPARTVQLEEVK